MIIKPFNGCSITHPDYLGANVRMWEHNPISTMDPMAEKKPWMSPYVYCSGNSVNRIDPDGRDETYYNSKGVQIKVVEKS